MKIAQLSRFTAERFVLVMLGRWGSLGIDNDITFEFVTPIDIQYERNIKRIYYSGVMLDVYVELALVDNPANVVCHSITSLAGSHISAIAEAFKEYHNSNNDLKFE